MRLLTAIVLAALAIVPSACAAPDPLADWTSTEATITRIDRICSTVPRSGTISGATRTFDCRLRPEHLKATRGKSDRAQRIPAIARVKFVYVLPGDWHELTSELSFDSADDRFYSLKADDRFPILVARAHPARVRAR